MIPALLDANVLIALVVAEHEHHERASRWLAGQDGFAVCPITQGALVRFLVRLGESGATADAVLRGIAEHPGYEFWADSVSYAEFDLAQLRGHRQVTDVYLAVLAADRNTRLATFDEGLQQAHPRIAFLVP